MEGRIERSNTMACSTITEYKINYTKKLSKNITGIPQYHPLSNSLLLNVAAFEQNGCDKSLWMTVLMPMKLQKSHPRLNESRTVVDTRISFAITAEETRHWLNKGAN